MGVDKPLREIYERILEYFTDQKLFIAMFLLIQIFISLTQVLNLSIHPVSHQIGQKYILTRAGNLVKCDIRMETTPIFFSLPMMR